MKKERKSRRAILRRQIFGALFGLGGFLVIVVAAILQENGIEPNFFVVVGMALAFVFTALLVEISTLRDGFCYDMEDFMSMMPFFLKGLSRDKALETFREHGFRQITEEIWMRTAYSLALNFFQYFVRWVYVGDGTDEIFWNTITLVLADMATLEQQRFKKRKNGVLCLFLEVEHVDEATQQSMREISQQLLFESFTLPFQKSKTLVIVLVDRVSGQGYFWTPLKSQSIYGQGCELLKKYFT